MICEYKILRYIYKICETQIHFKTWIHKKTSKRNRRKTSKIGARQMRVSMGKQINAPDLLASKGHKNEKDFQIKKMKISSLTRSKSCHFKKKKF